MSKNGIKPAKIDGVEPAPREETKQVKKDDKKEDKAKRKAKKNKKDKSAPKKPICALFAYVKSRRSDLKKTHPELSNTELITKMAQEWKALPEKEKEPFELAFQKDKERFAQEKKAYEEKKKSEAHPPKRAMTAYFCYLKSRRAALKKEWPDLKNTELAVKVGEEWKALSPAAKAPYEKMSTTEKERFKQETEAYVEKNGQKPEVKDVKKGKAEKDKQVTKDKKDKKAKVDGRDGKGSEDGKDGKKIDLPTQKVEEKKHPAEGSTIH